jgi:hypothetical protein
MNPIAMNGFKNDVFLIQSLPHPLPLTGAASVNEVVSNAAAGCIAPHDFQQSDNARKLTLSIRPHEE